MQFFILRVNIIEALQGGDGFIFVAGFFFERRELLYRRGIAAAYGAVFFELGDGGGFVVLGEVGVGEAFIDAVLLDVIGIPVANGVSFGDDGVVVAFHREIQQFLLALLPVGEM